MNIEIQTGALTGSRLIEDYLEGASALSPFYRGWPWEVEAYRAKAAEVDRRFDAEKLREMAGLIRATSPGAAVKLEEVVGGEGLFVTTGHQAGLFTGPLFTIHKILSAIRLASALESALNRPVAPLFWIASDDHDWAEVNHVDVLDRKNELHRIVVESPSDSPPLSMRNRLLGPGVETAFTQLTEVLPPSEFAPDLLKSIREAYRPERTVAEAFGDVIAELFSAFDLLIVDGGHPGVKRLSAELVERELESSADHEARLSERTRLLEAAGYSAQVPVLEGATNVFLEDEQGRERLFRTDDGYVLRRSGRRLGVTEVKDRLRQMPEAFSANVFLRPVVESSVFPTIAYVGGPAEVSYFAQVSALFEAHGIEPPVAVPRFSVTLIERKVRKVMDKFGLAVTDFRPPTHEIAARVLREEMPTDVAAALGALRGRIGEGYADLLRAVQAIDPTLKGPIQSARNASHMQLGEAEKRITQALKKQNALGIDQLDKARVNLYPNGQPQERVLNIYPYLVRYGRALLPEIAESMQVRLGVAARSDG